MLGIITCANFGDNQLQGLGVVEIKFQRSQSYSPTYRGGDQISTAYKFSSCRYNALPHTVKVSKK